MTHLAVELTGRIYRGPESDTDLYVSVIDAWDIAACGRTIDEALAMMQHLIDGHLATARQLGVLDRELRKVGVAPPQDNNLRLQIK